MRTVVLNPGLIQPLSHLHRHFCVILLNCTFFTFPKYSPKAVLPTFNRPSDLCSLVDGNKTLLDLAQ